jgi:hypothetical protein
VVSLEVPAESEEEEDEACFSRTSWRG